MGIFQGDDSRSDDSNSYIKEENKLAFSPIAESPMAEKDPYEENIVVDIDIVIKVVEKILNKGLETLALVAQKFSNTYRDMIIWMDPLKKTSATNGNSSLPQMVDNSHHSSITTQSSPTSLLDVIFLLAKQLNSKREK